MMIVIVKVKLYLNKSIAFDLQIILHMKSGPLGNGNEQCFGRNIRRL